MPKVDIFDHQGQKAGKYDLPREIFAAPVNQALIAQAVRVYLANQRRAKAKTKSRGEVIGSRRKIWRQKGTGRARHGDRYAPIFVGGGRAHGPTGKENYRLEMSKKMKRQALFSALTSRVKENDVLVIKDLAKIKPKTKEAAILIKKLGVNDQKNSKLTLYLSESLENVRRSFGNIENVFLVQVELINAYQVLNAGKMIFTEESLAKMNKVYGTGSKITKKSVKIIRRKEKN